MKIEIWSDVVCPFCYIGKRNLEMALKDFPFKDQVEIQWRSFELDPQAQPDPDMDMYDRLASKYGKSREWAEENTHSVTSYAAAVGLTFYMSRVVPANTFDAHRLIHLAAASNLQDEMKERLMAAYFTEGKNIGDYSALQQVAQEVGLNNQLVTQMLETKEYASEVRSDEHDARQLGIRGVPFFLFNRKYSVSGAQPSELFSEVLQQIWDEENTVTSIKTNAEDNECSDGICNT